MRFLERLLKWMDVPVNLLLWIGLIAGFLMMMHVAVDVTGRTVFNHPFSGTTEVVSAWYMVACAYLPLAWITRHDNHIVAGVFQQIGTKRFAYYLECAVKAFMTVYMAVFTWQTYLRAVQQTRAGEVWEAAGGFIPVWPSRWMLPVTGALMVLYLIIRIARDLVRGPQD